jgi:TonB family protein
MSSFRVVNRKKRFIVGGATVAVIMIMFTIGYINQKPRDYGSRLFFMDIFSDALPAPIKNVVAIYESTGDETCASALREAQNANASKDPAPLVFAAKPACKAKVARPEGYQQLGKEGFVLLALNINKAGVVERAEVEKTSGFEPLDTAAVKEVVENWTFEPCKKQDNAVSCRQNIQFRWKL